MWCSAQAALVVHKLHPIVIQTEHNLVPAKTCHPLHTTSLNEADVVPPHKVVRVTEASKATISVQDLGFPQMLTVGVRVARSAEGASAGESVKKEKKVIILMTVFLPHKVVLGSVMLMLTVTQEEVRVAQAVTQSEKWVDAEYGQKAESGGTSRRVSRGRVRKKSRQIRRRKHKTKGENNGARMYRGGLKSRRGRRVSSNRGRGVEKLGELISHRRGGSGGGAKHKSVSRSRGGGRNRRQRRVSLKNKSA